MAENYLLYYITDRTAFPGDERTRRLRLLDKIAAAATQGVDYIQLREKDLSTSDLESLAREAMSIMPIAARSAPHRVSTTVPARPCPSGAPTPYASEAASSSDHLARSGHHLGPPRARRSPSGRLPRAGERPGSSDCRVHDCRVLDC